MNNESPLHQYWQLSATPLQGLHVCDINEWKDATQGLYFNDGAISSDSRLFKPFPVTVRKCDRVTDRAPWNSCSFLVRPIVPCDAQDGHLGFSDCRNSEVCAWDIVREDAPDSWLNPLGTATSLGKVPRCDQGSGLCGWVASLGRMVGRYSGGSDGLRELNLGLKLAADHFDVKSGEGLPLLHLGDPSQAAKELSAWQPLFFALVFFYVPATVVAMCILCWMDGGCERFFGAYIQVANVCEGEAETDDDD
eukprot:CAMPEP_0181409804 /NCGR_PEP_ID=MMETSP1110-20121109/7011_1 /TAXON_ID=174948 /ORGANISM="Symbiodinium sp., Strain CCMP421" /LENGTH=249 /DNA_ID=CAMNT_0023532329 /DNA_START=243 /DNA_END=992 /DNA_ORIENTATION=-